MKVIKNEESVYRVQSLERALDILDCFTFQNREMSLSEVVKLTKLNKTTAKRLLSNFTYRGYLQQDLNTKRYQLGLRLFELGGIVFSSFSLRKAAAHPMTHLQNETEATILLGVMMEDQLVYVDKREGLGMIRISSDIGWRRPLHYGMLGMVLMAYLRPEKAKEIFKRNPMKTHTPHSITDWDAFSLRLEQIRKDGSVVETEEAVEGIIGIAAPIRDFSREVAAALGVALPISQSSEKEIRRIVRLVKRSTNEISTSLGYLKI